MRTTTPCCHTFLAFVLKFLNFLQSFVGLSIIIYSIYMLSRWHHSSSVLPPAPAPSAEFPGGLVPGFETISVSHNIPHLSFPDDVFVSSLNDDLGADSNSLPVPWFIYAFMGVGIVLCCITFVGHIAAEAINSCCLCFYSLLTTLLILVEAALVAFIAIDQQWERDLPFDHTGQLDNLRTFIEDNAEVCKWVGITVFIIQVLSLLVAIIFRAIISSQRVDDDIEEDYDARDRTREPLLGSHLNQSTVFIKGDGSGGHSDIWSSRMREKYGLNGGEAKHLPNHSG